ncbi:zeta-sarcoglycan isoform 1-T1 [Acridotheres tristis]
MDRSANLDTEELKMTREQYILATQQNSLPRTEHPQFYPVGIYGWRKRCLYFFVLLLLVTMIVNLAMTIWILKVMNFTVDGMGNLRVTKKGIRLEGISEFLLPLYVKEIHSRKDSPLVLQSDRNVTVNARNHMGQLTGQLTVGADAVEAQCKRFEVRASDGGKVLFSADEDEIVIGADRLKVTGTEGAVFGHSVETPHIRAEPSQDLKLESPTRSLVMEAPRGVQVNAAAGDLKATCRKELHLQSTEGEIFLNADTIRLGNLPVGSFSSSSFSSSSSPSSSAPRQTIYELCACPNVQFGFPCDKFDASNGLQSNFFHCKQENSAAFSRGFCCHSTQRWERLIQKSMYSSSGNLEHEITFFSKRDNNTGAFAT